MNIEVGKTYDGATVTRITDGYNRHSRKIIHYRTTLAKWEQQASEVWFRENYVKQQMELENLSLDTGHD